VTNIFNRWGNRVATPLGPRAGFASTGNGMRPTGAGAMQAMTPEGRNTTAASIPPRAAAKAMTGTASSNPNLQVYRHADGQWQRFAGNGHWQNVSPQSLPGWMQSPGSAKDFRGATDLPLNSSGVRRDASQESMERQPMSPSAPSVAAGPQGNRWSVPAPMAGATPGGPGRFGSPEAHAFVPGNGHFVQGWGGAESSFGRGSGRWIQSPGYAAGGGHAAFGGGGHGWSGGGGHAWGGGGGHMGGGSSHR
jgi:hypothetical protein